MQDLQQRDEVVALATAGDYRKTPGGIGLFEGLATNAQGWVRDAAAFETARIHFRAAHFDPTISICHKLLQDAEEGSPWRARILILLSAATMSNAALEDEDATEVQRWLDDALEICEANRDTYLFGRVLREKGILAHWKGEIEDGSALLGLGQQLSAAYSGPGAPGRAVRTGLAASQPAR